MHDTHEVGGSIPSTPTMTRFVEPSPVREAVGSRAAVTTGAPILSMAFLWHDDGMSRTRVSTTVDEDKLADARRLRPNTPDATLLDEALEALIARHRAVELDATYASYDEHPLDEADEWGDLASFRQAAAAS
jgi:hypothetical protein